MTDEAVTLPSEPQPLVDYDTWVAEAERGESAAHTDATTPPDERMTPEDVLAEGKPFWSGYNAHWTTLQNAGVAQ